MILTRIIATLKDVAKCSEVGCLHPLQSSLAKIVSWRCGQTGGGEMWAFPLTKARTTDCVL